MTYQDPTRVPANRAASVSCIVPVLLEAVGSDLTVLVPSFLWYDVGEPYAIHMDIFTGHGEPITWLFARDLLRTGLREPAGQGDVTIRTNRRERPGHVLITLTGERSSALMRARPSEIEYFLRQTDDLVPPGTEHQHLDLDILVGQLLGRPAPRPPDRKRA
ncbi:SsgA family sporulation/cell division regulator [Streptomyces sp. NBC_00435]|uniref:SsgA family sporulation/cell division regulator n=1 Tax=Streptomyces sp. NBC_00435 TaxID=2903649 RepID=UPI002E1BC437